MLLVHLLTNTLDQMISDAIKSQNSYEVKLYKPSRIYPIMFNFFLSPKAKNDLNIGSLYNFKISKPHNFCQKTNCRR